MKSSNLLYIFTLIVSTLAHQSSTIKSDQNQFSSSQIDLNAPENKGYKHACSLLKKARLEWGLGDDKNSLADYNRAIPYLANVYYTDGTQSDATISEGIQEEAYVLFGDYQKEVNFHLKSLTDRLHARPCETAWVLLAFCKTGKLEEAKRLVKDRINRSHYCDRVDQLPISQRFTLGSIEATMWLILEDEGGVPGGLPCSIRLLKKADALAPHSMAILSKMGRRYMESAHYKEAMPVLEEAEMLYMKAANTPYNKLMLDGIRFDLKTCRNAWRSAS